MHQLNLFGHPFRPQSQDLLANQPIIIIIMASFLYNILSKASLIIIIIHVPSGMTKVSPACTLGDHHQSSKIWVDVPIQLNQFGQLDSLGKSTR